MYRLILSALLLLLFLNIFSCEFEPEPAGSPKTHQVQQLPEKPEPVLDVFGIDESLEVRTHIIRRNESLSGILRENGLTSRQVHELTSASGELFNARRIRPGRPLHLYMQTDSTNNKEVPDHIVYEESQTGFIRFDISDTITVTRDSKPVETKTRIVSGEINGSLFRTMQQLGVDQQLTHRLADVYAWQVDFYRIQQGDHFKVLFEEHYVEGELSGIGKIEAAIFNHRNKDYYAFHYRQNGTDEYFDENGNSLRRQFMAAPLDYTRISSRFTNRRYHPVLQRNMPHHGTDYVAAAGTPVRAVGEGEVTNARYGRNNGNFVRIRHNNIYETGYLHLSRFAEGIQSGVEVEQGQIIGYVGQTGLATGPHLCFRFWKYGRPVDPQNIDLPPADPIQEDHRENYLARKEQLLDRLEVDPDTVLPRPVSFAINIGYSGVLSDDSPADQPPGRPEQTPGL